MRNYHIPTAHLPGHTTEDPCVAQPYAFIPNGPTFWIRESFEATVSREDRWRFTINTNHISTPQTRAAEGSNQSIEEVSTEHVETPRIPDGVYSVNGETITVHNGAAYLGWNETCRCGEWIGSAPATEAELANLYREFCENCE